ncbi:MAG: serine/threonine protein kinase [Alphaproteobacteria bacterium]|nr:serine/threonine protein kinase [Alphaproteobacteria bacterium]
MAQYGDWIEDGPVGAGGFAQVIRAHHQHDPTQLAAVKVLLPEWRKRSTMRARFADEVRTSDLIGEGAARVASLPAYLGADTQGEIPWLAIEWVDGRALSAVLKTGRFANGHLLPRDTDGRAAFAMQVGAAVAEALAYTHRRGIVHRDIKAENILCARDGRFVLIDFGIARDARGGDRHTSEGMPSPLTPSYAAPELLESRVEEHLEPALDVYALGCTLYEILTGNLGTVQTANTTAGVMRWIARTDPLRVPDRWPADLAGLIAECTHPDPGMRPGIGQILSRLKRTTASSEAETTGSSTPIVNTFDLAEPPPSPRPPPLSPSMGATILPSTTQMPTEHAPAAARRATDPTLAPHAPTLDPGRGAGPTMLPSDTQMPTVGPDHGFAQAPPRPPPAPAHDAYDDEPLIVRRSNPLPWMLAVAALMVAGAAVAWVLSQDPPAEAASLEVVDVPPAPTPVVVEEQVEQPPEPTPTPTPEPARTAAPARSAPPPPAPTPDPAPRAVASTPAPAPAAPPPPPVAAPTPQPAATPPRVEDLLTEAVAEPPPPAPPTPPPASAEPTFPPEGDAGWRAYAQHTARTQDRQAFQQMADHLAENATLLAPKLSSATVETIIDASMRFDRLPYPKSGASAVIAPHLKTVGDNASCKEVKTWLRWIYGTRAGSETSSAFYRKWCQVCTARHPDADVDAQTCYGMAPERRWVNGRCVHVDVELFPKRCE